MIFYASSEKSADGCATTCDWKLLLEDSTAAFLLTFMSLSSHCQHKEGSTGELAVLAAATLGGLFLERWRTLGQFVSSRLRTLSQITAQITLYSPVYDGSLRSSQIERRSSNKGPLMTEEIRSGPGDSFIASRWFRRPHAPPPSPLSPPLWNNRYTSWANMVIAEERIDAVDML